MLRFMVDRKKLNQESLMTLKKLIALCALLASFSALAIPPIPPSSIQKPINTNGEQPKSK